MLTITLTRQAAKTLEEKNHPTI